MLNWNFTDVKMHYWTLINNKKSFPTLTNHDIKTDLVLSEYSWPEDDGFGRLLQWRHSLEGGDEAHWSRGLKAGRSETVSWPTFRPKKRKKAHWLGEIRNLIGRKSWKLYGQKLSAGQLSDLGKGRKLIGWERSKISFVERVEIWTVWSCQPANSQT